MDLEIHLLFERVLFAQYYNCTFVKDHRYIFDYIDVEDLRLHLLLNRLCIYASELLYYPKG